MSAYEQALADVRAIPTTQPISVPAALVPAPTPARKRGGRGADPAQCGTYSGYQSHHARGEKPCWACREARRERDRAYYADHRDQVLARRRAGGVR